MSIGMYCVQFRLYDTWRQVTEEIGAVGDDWMVRRLWKAFESDFRDKAIVEEQMKRDDETTAFQLHRLLINKGYQLSRRTILRWRRSLGWTFRGKLYVRSSLLCDALWATHHVKTIGKIGIYRFYGTQSFHCIIVVQLYLRKRFFVLQ